MSLTVRDVMYRAMRLNGALAAGDDPEPEDLADVFEAFNTLKRSWFGTLIGVRLSPQPTAGVIAQAENGGEYAIAAGAPFTVTAPLNPKNGARFGVVDAGLGFATYPCTINPNGRLIDGAAANLVLNVSGIGGRWWFRGDTADWILEADFATYDSAIEWPDTMIAYMPYMLAAVIGAEYNTELRQDIIAANIEGRALMARTYARRGRNQIDPPIGAPGPAPAAQQAQG